MDMACAPSHPPRPHGRSAPSNGSVPRGFSRGARRLRNRMYASTMGFLWDCFLSGLLATLGSAQSPAPSSALFVQRCAFCHGRDAGGGETGPDLTRSKMVADDTGG